MEVFGRNEIELFRHFLNMISSKGEEKRGERSGRRSPFDCRPSITASDGTVKFTSLQCDIFALWYK